MGLDGVEIIMSLEETFGLELSDEETGNCHTAGDITRLIQSKLNVDQGQSACLSQAAFHLCRKSYLDLWGGNRNDFRLGTPLRTLFPREGRRDA